MKTIFTCLSALPLLTLPILAETAPAVPAEKVAQNKMIIKLGLSLSEVESILSKQVLSLKRWTPPVSTVVHYEPKDSFAASLHLWEGKAGYFLHFEWDEDRQCHLLDSIELSDDLDALLEHYNSKASEEVEEPCRSRHVKTIVFDPDSLRQDIERYKEVLAEEVEDTHEYLKKLRQSPTRGKVAREICRQDHPSSGNFELDHYKEYIDQEIELIAQLAFRRYDSKEEQAALWQNTLKAKEKLQQLYPRSARALPSLIDLVDSLYQEQCQISAQQRAKSYESIKLRLDKHAEENDLPRFHLLPVSVQNYSRQYLCAILLAEADIIERTSDIDEIHYLTTKAGVQILKGMDASALPEGYRMTIEKYIKQMEAILSSCKDGKMTKDIYFLSDAYNTSSAGVGDSVIPPDLSKRFIKFMDHSRLLHAIMEHDDLLDYYFYLVEIRQRKGFDDFKSFSFICRALVEKIKEG